MTDQKPGSWFLVNRDQAQIVVSKVNVNSDLRSAYRTTLEDAGARTRTSTRSSS